MSENPLTLLACPFCGADAAEMHENQHAGMAWVACIVCGLEAPSETGVTPEQAADYWNSRPDASSQAEIERLRNSGREFMEAAEAVFDWMNGNDLSADHEEQHPDDFERVSKALVAFRAALSGSKE